MAAENIQTAVPASGSESVFDFFCELCADDNKHIEADGFCQDCGDFLCAKCFEAHPRSKFTKYHILLDKDQMPKDKTQSSERNTCKDLCADHSGKIVDFFCETHDFFGCYVCITTNHKSCKDVVHIPEVSKTVMESEEFEKFENGFKTIQKSSQVILEKASVNAKKVEEYYTQVLEAIENQRRLIDDTLDKLAEQLRGKYEEIKLQDERRLKLVSDTCTDVLKEANTILEDIDIFTKNRQQCQIFTLMKESQRQMQSLQNTLTKAEKDVAVKEYTFKPNEEIHMIMKEAEILGSLFETKRGQINCANEMLLQFSSTYKDKRPYCYKCYKKRHEFEVEKEVKLSWGLKHNKTNRTVASFEIDDENLSFVPSTVCKLDNSCVAVTIHLTDNINWSYINTLIK